MITASRWPAAYAVAKQHEHSSRGECKRWAFGGQMPHACAETDDGLRL